MKLLTKSLLAVSALALVPVLASAQAQAQEVAYSDVEAVISLSAAAKKAFADMRVTYKAQYDALETRNAVLKAELNTLVVKYQADAKINANNPTLANQAKAIQDKQAAAEQEVNRLQQPIARVEQFVLEQIDTKLDGAVSAAMTKKKVALLISRQAVIKNTPGTDLTQDIVNELNVMLPGVSIVPPANWQPGQNKPGAAPAPSTPQPLGR